MATNHHEKPDPVGSGAPSVAGPPLPKFPNNVDLVQDESHAKLLQALLPALNKYRCLEVGVKKTGRSPFVRAFCDLYHPAGPWGRFSNVPDITSSQKWSFKSYKIPKIYETLQRRLMRGDGEASAVHVELHEALNEYYSKEQYYKDFMAACEPIAANEANKPIAVRASFPKAMETRLETGVATLVVESQNPANSNVATAANGWRSSVDPEIINKGEGAIDIESEEKEDNSPTMVSFAKKLPPTPAKHHQTRANSKVTPSPEGAIFKSKKRPFIDSSSSSDDDDDDDGHHDKRAVDPPARSTSRGRKEEEIKSGNKKRRASPKGKSERMSLSSAKPHHHRDSSEDEDGGDNHMQEEQNPPFQSSRYPFRRRTEKRSEVGKSKKRAAPKEEETSDTGGGTDEVEPAKVDTKSAGTTYDDDKQKGTSFSVKDSATTKKNKDEEHPAASIEGLSSEVGGATPVETGSKKRGATPDERRHVEVKEEPKEEDPRGVKEKVEEESSGPANNHDKKKKEISSRRSELVKMLQRRKSDGKDDSDPLCKKIEQKIDAEDEKLLELILLE